MGALLLLLLALCAAQAHALKGQGELRVMMIKAALAQDPAIKIATEDVSRAVTAINVTVLNCREAACREADRQDKAQALATLLPRSIIRDALQSNVLLNVIQNGRVVPYKPLPANQAVAWNTTRNALRGNAYFLGGIFVQGKVGVPPRWFLMVRPTVVQYHSDNSNDLNGLTTQTASDLLSDLCDLESTVNYVVFNNAECEGPRATGGNGCFKPVYFQD